MPFSNQHPQQWDKEGAAIRRTYTLNAPGNLFTVLNFSGFQQLFKNVRVCSVSTDWLGGGFQFSCIGTMDTLSHPSFTQINLLM